MRSNVYILVLSLLTVLLTAEEEKSGLEHLNTLRQKSGLMPLQENRRLSKAASSHAHYLVLHQEIGHLEQRNRKGYTGKTPSDRVVYQGYDSKDVMENVAVNAQNGTAAVDELLAAIYHRFVFLNFDKDQIGVGRASTKSAKRTKNAYVYKLGSSKLNALCRRAFIPVRGNLYLKDVCKNSESLIPQELYEKKQKEIKYRNAKVVLHPYPGQKEVKPAFYNEEPDPLPDYDVSGYPVSVEFSDLYYKSIRLKSFRLFDDENREIPMRRILTHANDPHHRLKKTQFALMPIKRLEYETDYKAEFEAVVDGEPYHRSWEFTTRSFEEKLYRITKKDTILNGDSGSTFILYFVPKSRNDLLKSFRATSGVKVSFIDQNTLRVEIPQRLKGKARVKSGGRSVLFK
jgi:hypothetical protein